MSNMVSSMVSSMVCHELMSTCSACIVDVSMWPVWQSALLLCVCMLLACALLLPACGVSEPWAAQQGIICLWLAPPADPCGTARSSRLSVPRPCIACAVLMAAAKRAPQAGEPGDRQWRHSAGALPHAWPGTYGTRRGRRCGGCHQIVCFGLLQVVLWVQ